MKHNTLNQALESINCIEFWPLGTNVNYSQNQRVYFKKDKKYNVIVVDRDENGLYEILTYQTE